MSLTVVSPWEVYADALPEVPDSIIAEINGMLVQGKQDDPSIPITINATTIEELMNKYRAEIPLGTSSQKLFYAILLRCSEHWYVDHKDAVVYFSPLMADSGKRKIRTHLNLGGEKYHR